MTDDERRPQAGDLEPAQTLLTRLDALMPGVMTRIAVAWPYLMSPWGLRGLAFLAGFMAAFAHPPFGFLPGLMGYGLLLYVLERELGPKPLHRALNLGWIAGFAYFLVSCFWVAEPFLVDAETYGWMAPFAVSLLPLGIGFFWGLTGILYRWLAPKGLWRGPVFCACFITFELARGTLLTGFPWNPAGTSWLAGSAMSQLASILGVTGLGAVTVLIGLSPFVISFGKGFKGFVPLMTAMVLLVAGLGFGQYRLSTTVITPSDFLVRVIQPNVGQKAKWDRGGFTALFTDYFTMSRAPLRLSPAELAHAKGKTHPDMIIWPEGALPISADDLFSNESWTSEAMTQLLEDKQMLIFGAYRGDEDEKLGRVWRNSLLVMQQQGSELHGLGVYNKYKLVPVGEFLPMESVLGRIGFKNLVHIGDGFTPGSRTASMTINPAPRFLPLICYEGLFADLDGYSPKSDNDPERPHWIVNISNDAWFGPTSGPVQHLNLASYRAIEEGIAMVRSTPTGISTLVDPLGRRILAKTIGLNHRGYVDLLVPGPAPVTAHALSRQSPKLLIVFFLLLFGLRRAFYVWFQRKPLRNRTG